MAILISGNGIDMGNNPVSNASQIDSTVINENNENVATTSNLVGFKNYIINGDMRIAQRGIGPFTANGYGIDQWFSYISSGASNVIRSWEGTGSNHISYAQVHVGSGADTVTTEQRLETPHRFSGKTLTLSYKLFNGNYSGSGVNYNISLDHAGGRTVLFSGISVFAGGTKKKVTFTVPDLSGYTLNTSSYLEIRPVEIIGHGYSGTFGITDIQLEEGSVATPFENRPYGLELSLCQRYAKIMYVAVQNQAITVSGQNTVQNMSFPDMRVIPTLTNISVAYAGSINNSNFILVQNNRIQYEFYYGSLNALGGGSRIDLLSAEL